MVRRKTPEWMDELFEREEISPEEYYEELGMTRKKFWELYWEIEESYEGPT